jgi:predicted nucleic acid-binding protein
MQIGQVVIADAGPVIALSRIGLLPLLPQSFSSIVITETVRDELLTGSFAGQVEIQTALQTWLQAKQVSTQQLALANSSLDPGERSSIALCLQLPGSLLIVDDMQGRKEAQALGLAFTGLVGVMLRAHQRGLLPKLQRAFESLKQCNYFLSERLIEQVLRQTGELAA